MGQPTLFGIRYGDAGDALDWLGEARMWCCRGAGCRRRCRQWRSCRWRWQGRTAACDDKSKRAQDDGPPTVPNHHLPRLVALHYCSFSSTRHRAPAIGMAAALGARDRCYQVPSSLTPPRNGECTMRRVRRRPYSLRPATMAAHARSGLPHELSRSPGVGGRNASFRRRLACSARRVSCVGEFGPDHAATATSNPRPFGSAPIQTRSVTIAAGARSGRSQDTAGRVARRLAKGLSVIESFTRARNRRRMCRERWSDKAGRGELRRSSRGGPPKEGHRSLTS